MATPEMNALLDSLPITEQERETARALLEQIEDSIHLHLTPRKQMALLERGITRAQAIEYLARRALQAVIAEGRIG